MDLRRRRCARFLSVPTASMRAGLLALAVAALAGTAAADSPYPLFQAPFESFNGGGRPYDVAAGDVNGDGHSDLVVTGDGNVMVLRGRGDGTFEHRTPLPFGAGAVELGDLNGDGYLDLVAGTYNSLIVALNPGNGAFGPRTAYGGYTASLVLADMNRDGRLDVVTGGVAIYLGNGDGTLGAPTTTPAGYSAENDIAGSIAGGLASVAVGDIDGDGNLDVAVPHGRSLEMHPCWSEYHGNGDGTVGPPVGREVCGIGHPFYLAIGDLDGDGDGEVLWDTHAVLDLNGDGANDIVSGGVGVTLGRPGGGFGPHVGYFVGNSVANVAFADFDEDGALDIVAATWGCALELSHIEIVCEIDSYPTTVSLLRGRGDGTFGRGGSSIPISGVTSTVVADLDRDGLADLVATHSSAMVSVRPGLGDGTFAPATTYAVAGAAMRAQIEDVDGDGELDLATPSGSLVTVLRGLGGGALGDRRDVAVGGVATDVAFGDLNGDAALDLVAATFNGVAVALGNGDATYGPPTLTAPSADRVVIGDLNADSRKDVVAFHPGVGIRAWLGNGSGGFIGFVHAHPQTSLWEAEIALADLNGDGRLDLAATLREYTPSATYGMGIVRRGVGNGTFQAAQWWEAASQPASLVVTDVDGDGTSDLVTADDVSGAASVLLGNGDATFQAKLGYGAPSGRPDHLSIGDLNEDGRPDLIMTHRSTGRISVLLSRPKDDVTPVLVAAFRAERVAGGIAVAWRFAEPGRVVSSRVERAERSEGPWVEVAAERSMSGGESVVMDGDPESDRWYRLVAIDANRAESVFGPLFVAGRGARFTTGISVAPNPSAGQVVLEYSLAAEGHARLSILDLQGREVVRLIEGRSSAGRHRLEWSGHGARGRLPSGIYFARLETPLGVVTRRFVRAR